MEMGKHRHALAFMVLLAAATCIHAQQAGPMPSASNAEAIPPPAIQQLRWQSFPDKVYYVVADRNGRPWFLMVNGEYEKNQYVSEAAPEACFLLPKPYNTLGVDARNGLWVAGAGTLHRFNLNDGSRTERAMEGLFAQRSTDGWPDVTDGQVWTGHSAGRVYVHDRRGVHLHEKGEWSFHAWPEKAIGKPGVDLKAARFGHSEGPDGIAYIWSTGNQIGGLWSHDGAIWRLYSAAENPKLQSVSAVIPLSRGYALVCREKAPAFRLDLSTGICAGHVPAAVIAEALASLSSKDPNKRGRARQRVAEMVKAAPDKVKEVAGWIAEDAQRRRAMEAIAAAEKNKPHPEPDKASPPPLPELPLEDGRIVLRAPEGGTLMTWKEKGEPRMGVLKANGEVVRTPEGMDLTSDRPYGAKFRLLPGGKFLTATNGLWLWDGKEFRRMFDEDLYARGRFLEIDGEGRVYLWSDDKGHMLVFDATEAPPAEGPDR